MYLEAKHTMLAQGDAAQQLHVNLHRYAEDSSLMQPCRICTRAVEPHYDQHIIATTPHRLYKDLHAAAQTQHQVQRGLLLNVVVRQGAAVLQLLAREDQALLVRRDACIRLGVERIAHEQATQLLVL
jgi:hypothetical protein